MIYRIPYQPEQYDFTVGEAREGPGFSSICDWADCASPSSPSDVERKRVFIVIDSVGLSLEEPFVRHLVYISFSTRAHSNRNNTWG